MKKIAFRTLLLLALCVGFLYLMQRFGLLRVADILAAFEKRPSTLLLLAAVQALTAFLMMIRYGALLHVLGIKAPLKQISSATFVSTAVGQWAPGSLAVVEVLRVGLMFGSHSNNPSTLASTGADVGIKARLAIASFADRLIGFLGILITGFVFSVYIFIISPSPQSVREFFSGSGLLLFSSGLGVLALSALPFAARLKVVRQAHLKLKVGGTIGGTIGGRTWNSALRHIETLRHNVDAGTRHPLRLVRPLLLSMASLLLTSCSLYLSALAIGQSLNFLQIVCAYPLISLSAILPLGFAGIGGYQIIMASIFGLFSVSPAIVASSGVLQSAVVLVVNTIIGLFYARVSSQQIRAIFKQRAASGSI